MRPTRRFILAVLIATYIAAGSSWATPVVTSDARSAAMGGIGVASGVKAAPMNNPAMLAYGVEFVDWYLSAAYMQHSDDPDNFENLLDDFQQSVSNLADNPTPNNARQTEAALTAMSGATLINNELGAVYASVPSNILGAGVFFSGYSFASMRADVGSYDFTNPAAPVYNAVVEKRGVSVIEHGVSIAQVFTTDFRGFNTFALGISPKIVLWQAVARSEDATSADTEARFGGSRDGSAFSLDFGVLKELGRFYNGGLFVRNLVPVTIHYPESHGGTESLNTQVRAGIAYERRTRSFEIDLDLVPNSGVGLQESSRILAIGGEIVLTHFMVMRAGLRQNLLGEQDSLLTFGVGIGVDYTLDLAVHGGADELGATGQFTITF